MHHVEMLVMHILDIIMGNCLKNYTVPSMREMPEILNPLKPILHLFPTGGEVGIRLHFYVYF